MDAAAAPSRGLLRTTVPSWCSLLLYAQRSRAVPKCGCSDTGPHASGRVRFADLARSFRKRWLGLTRLSLWLAIAPGCGDSAAPPRHRTGAAPDGSASGQPAEAGPRGLAEASVAKPDAHREVFQDASGPHFPDARVRDASEVEDAGRCHEDVCAAPSPVCATEGGTRCDANIESGARGISLFNGVDLTGWHGDPSIWSVVDGAIVGSAPAGSVPVQTFLIYEGGPFADFVLTADVYLGPSGNTGIQYRSTETNPQTWLVAGYQFDAGGPYFGSLYEDGGRGTILLSTPACTQAVKANDYNAFEVQATGPNLLHRLNGIECITFKETVASKPVSGIIALQYHPPGGYEVRVRNFQLRVLR
jgi:hypothetical protein